MDNSIVKIDFPIKTKDVKLIKEYGFSNFREMFYSDNKNVILLYSNQYFIEPYEYTDDIVKICTVSTGNAIGLIDEVKDESVVITLLGDKSQRDHILFLLGENKVSLMIHALANKSDKCKENFKFIKLSLRIDE